MKATSSNTRGGPPFDDHLFVTARLCESYRHPGRHRLPGGTSVCMRSRASPATNAPSSAYDRSWRESLDFSVSGITRTGMG